MPPGPVSMSHHRLNGCTDLKPAEHAFGILDESFRLLTDPSLSEQDREPQPGRDNQPRSE